MLHRYLDARASYCEWRDRYIVDTPQRATSQSVGMEDERSKMANAIDYMRFVLHVPEDEWLVLKDGTTFKVYSDPKNSIERRLYVQKD